MSYQGQMMTVEIGFPDQQIQSGLQCCFKIKRTNSLFIGFSCLIRSMLSWGKSKVINQRGALTSDGSSEEKTV